MLKFFSEALCGVTKDHAGNHHLFVPWQEHLDDPSESVSWTWWPGHLSLLLFFCCGFYFFFQTNSKKAAFWFHKESRGRKNGCHACFQSLHWPGIIYHLRVQAAIWTRTWLNFGSISSRAVKAPPVTIFTALSPYNAKEASKVSALSTGEAAP